MYKDPNKELKEKTLRDLKKEIKQVEKEICEYTMTKSESKEHRNFIEIKLNELWTKKRDLISKIANIDAIIV